MGCEHEGGGFYRPRQPNQTAFYQWVEKFYPQFEAVDEERYQECYGFWRPAIDTAVEKFLQCGDLEQGFARVRCPDCAFEFFVAFSCRGRCFCPRCGVEMKIISFIQRHQSEVIEKILRHCGLWEETSTRAPPPAQGTAAV